MPVSSALITEAKRLALEFEMRDRRWKMLIDALNGGIPYAGGKFAAVEKAVAGAESLPVKLVDAKRAEAGAKTVLAHIAPALTQLRSKPHGGNLSHFYAERLTLNDQADDIVRDIKTLRSYADPDGQKMLKRVEAALAQGNYMKANAAVKSPELKKWFGMAAAGQHTANLARKADHQRLLDLIVLHKTNNDAITANDAEIARNEMETADAILGALQSVNKETFKKGQNGFVDSAVSNLRYRGAIALIQEHFTRPLSRQDLIGRMRKASSALSLGTFGAGIAFFESDAASAKVRLERSKPEVIDLSEKAVRFAKACERQVAQETRYQNTPMAVLLKSNIGCAASINDREMRSLVDKAKEIKAAWLAPSDFMDWYRGAASLGGPAPSASAIPAVKLPAAMEVFNMCGRYVANARRERIMNRTDKGPNP